MKRILIIDDDPTIKKLFTQFLQHKGYDVECASNGRIGMEMIEANPPDLVITDILMPEMDGLEILMQIRSTCKGLPVIAVSGGMRNLPINFLEQAKMLGARHVFEKPVPLNVLENTIINLLAEREA